MAHILSTMGRNFYAQTLNYLRQFLTVFVLVWSSAAHAGSYDIGTGIHDITGPVGEAFLVGYGMENRALGIQTRLWSRAFIIQDPNPTIPNRPSTKKSVVLVNVDLHSVSHGIKQGVAKKLKENGLGRYNNDNIMLMATHNHSGPGGFHHYWLLNSSSGGYDKHHYEVIVDGIYKSIRKAHNNLARGDVYLKRGELWNANVNRNPVSYNQNPDKVNYPNKALYSDFPNNVDKRMTLLKFRTDSGEDIGVLNWFSLHNVSLTSEQGQVSGDNKGIASQFFEKSEGTDYKADETFVAAFANSLLGDSSPSVCGPGNGCKSNKAAHAAYSAQKQYDTARSLFDRASPSDRLTGKLDYRHKFQTFPGYTVLSQNAVTGTKTKICDPAFGWSFTAGSTYDGFAGTDGAREGMTLLKPDSVKGRDIATAPCHYPKPAVGMAKIGELVMGVLRFLEFKDTANNTPPYTKVIPFQIMTVGELAIVSVAGEMTTMAGRRLEKDMLAKLKNHGITTVVISGPTNSYHGYITTPEEYNLQNYEGAHTVFGPNTLGAYRQVYGWMAGALTAGKKVITEPSAPDLSGKQEIESIAVFADELPLFPVGNHYGQVLQHPNPVYQAGEVVTAKFRSGSPRNNYLTSKSFMDVERYTNGKWTVYATDNDLSTTFVWFRGKGSGCGFCSTAIGKWTPDETTPTGWYRIVHRGHSRKPNYQQTPFSNATNSFFVGIHRDTIALKAPSGRYFTAVNNGGSIVEAKASAVQAHELFHVIKFEENRPLSQTAQCIRNGDIIGLKTSNGHFFSADPNKYDLRADRKHYKEWERFKVINHTGNGCWRGGNKISLKTYHNKHVRAKSGGRIEVGAPPPQYYERLTVELHSPVKMTPKMSLTSHHNRFLTAENRGGGRALDAAGPLEDKHKFDVYLIDLKTGRACIKDGSKIALRSDWGTYFQIQKDRTAIKADDIYPWSTFTVKIEQRGSPAPTSGCVQSNDKISLKSSRNKYIVAEPHGIINANRTQVGNFERWKVTLH